MIDHAAVNDIELRKLIRNGTVTIGGNRKLKIYGQLKCRSGKGMKRTNRVFFNSVQEAIQMGYRPCGHCFRTAYQNWRNGLI